MLKLNEVRAIVRENVKKYAGVEFYNKYHDDMLIAGGVFSNIANNLPLNDIDVYFRTTKARDEFVAKVEPTLKELECDISSKARIKIGHNGFWIDSCNYVCNDRFIGEGADIIKTFDFKSGMIYTSLNDDDRKWSYDNQAIAASNSRKLIINTDPKNVNSGLKMLYRGMKKISQGFDTEDGFFIFLVILLSKYDDNPELFHNDYKELKDSY